MIFLPETKSEGQEKRLSFIQLAFKEKLKRITLDKVWLTKALNLSNAHLVLYHIFINRLSLWGKHNAQAIKMPVIKFVSTAVVVHAEQSLLWRRPGCCILKCSLCCAHLILYVPPSNPHQEAGLQVDHCRLYVLLHRVLPRKLPC